MVNQSERDLIRSILDGKTSAFEQLVRRHQRPVFALIRQIVTCREDAEELTQDVFVKAFQKLNTFQGNSSFSTWIYRIAYNTAISATRKHRPEFPELDDKTWSNLADETVDELLDKTEDEEKLKRLEQAIEKLTMEERVMITLYYTEEKSMIEMASILQISTENAKIKLFRTRKKIVHLLNTESNEDR